MKPGLQSVVYVVDGKRDYRDMLAVSLHSLVSSCKSPIDVNVLYMPGSSIDENEKAAFTRIYESSRAVRITVSLIPDRYSRVLEATSGLTPLCPSCCARFLLPMVLHGVGQCLYVDCDTVFRRDPADAMSRFYSPWMDEVATAGVKDALVVLKEGVYPPWYVNGGVLLMDLDLWRARDLGERCMFDVLTGKRRFADQDTVNMMDRPVSLPECMNFLASWINFEMPIEGYNHLYGTRYRDYDEAISNAAVLHYTGAAKPSLPLPSAKWSDVLRKEYEQARNAFLALDGKEK